MSRNSGPISSLRILISNDDGISASGISVLEKIAQGLSPDVWVVAPELNQSGVGHGLTLKRPLRIREVSSRRFAVDGTPSDCVAIAIQQILQDRPPDIILTGINEGENIASDVTCSGTLGAAMEGTFHQIPSIAFSQAQSGGPKWSTAEHFAPLIIKKLLSFKWDEQVFMSVNFPDANASEIQGVKVVSQGRHAPLRHVYGYKDQWGSNCYWVGSPTRDIHKESKEDFEALQEKYVTVTPLIMDLTHRNSLNVLNDLFPR